MLEIPLGQLPFLPTSVEYHKWAEVGCPTDCQGPFVFDRTRSNYTDHVHRCLAMIRPASHLVWQPCVGGVVVGNWVVLVVIHFVE